MKTCKKCTFFSDYFCRSFHIPISATSNATYCNNYKLTKVALEKEIKTSNIKCSECIEFNFGWCKRKRKSIEEPHKTRSCVKYRVKPKK